MHEPFLLPERQKWEKPILCCRSYLLEDTIAPKSAGSEQGVVLWWKNCGNTFKTNQVLEVWKYALGMLHTYN
jgi:hypothetical protein